MKYAQIFALGTILAMLSMLFGGGCATLKKGADAALAAANAETHYRTAPTDLQAQPVRATNGVTGRVPMIYE